MVQQEMMFLPRQKNEVKTETEKYKREKLDILGAECDMIQAEVYKSSYFLGRRNDQILYYDCTNYYFEIEQEDGSKKYGKGKDHRPNPIIQMGLFMDGDGIPLAFSLSGKCK